MPDEAIPFQHMFRPPRGKPAGPRTSSSRLVLYDTGGHGDAFLTTGPQAGQQVTERLNLYAES